MSFTETVTFCDEIYYIQGTGSVALLCAASGHHVDVSSTIRHLSNQAAEQ